MGDGAPDRAHRQRQVHHAAHRDQGDQVPAEEHRHRRGPGGVSPARHPAGAGQVRDRLRLRPIPALHPSARSRHHHDRRDPRPGDGADRGARRAHRPPRALDPAHQRRHLHGDAAHQHRGGAVPRRHRRQRGGGAAPRAESLRGVQGGLPAERRGGCPLRARSRPRGALSRPRLQGVPEHRLLGTDGALRGVLGERGGPAHGARRRRRRHDPAARDRRPG